MIWKIACLNQFELKLDMEIPWTSTSTTTRSQRMSSWNTLSISIKKTHEFVEDVKNIETQYRNEDRAVFGRGMYKVSAKKSELTNAYI